MKKPELLSLLRRYFFAILGGVLGLIFAVLFLTIGFWRTLLILVLMGGGVFGGFILDRKESFVNFLDRILPGTRQDDDDTIFKF